MGKKTRERENKKYKFYLREEEKLNKHHKICKLIINNYDYLFKCPKCGEMTDDSSQECIWCDNCKCRFNVCMECTNIKCNKCLNYMELFRENSGTYSLEEVVSSLWCKKCNIISHGKCNIIYTYLLEWAIEYDFTGEYNQVSSIKPQKIKYYLELDDFKKNKKEDDCNYGLNWYCPRCHNDEILFPD